MAIKDNDIIFSDFLQFLQYLYLLAINAILLQYISVLHEAEQIEKLHEGSRKTGSHRETSLIDIRTDLNVSLHKEVIQQVLVFDSNRLLKHILIHSFDEHLITMKIYKYYSLHIIFFICFY